MIKRINRIDNFGVFKNYRRTGNIEDFKDLNIIYGWNYSGKTTLSRILDCFNEKTISSDYHQANFEILDNDSKIFTKDNIQEFNKQVRVFNSDFQTNNLKWDGESFEPVLLLGEESIEKQRLIQTLAEKTERLSKIITLNQDISKSVKDKIENELSTKASFIKTKLEIVQAFSKTHLIPTFNNIKSDFLQHKLGLEDVTKLLDTAKMSDSDKKIDKQLLSLNLLLEQKLDNCKKILSEVPSFSKTIDYLIENPNISDWIEKGIQLHQEKTTCEFCNNSITESRKNELISHFSEDLKRHKEELNTFLTTLKDSSINIQKLDSRDFYSNLNINFTDINQQIESKVAEYNLQIEKLIYKVEQKLEKPFNQILDFSDITNNTDEIQLLISTINSFFAENNQYTTDFKTKKDTAKETLIKHYTAELIENLQLSKLETKSTIVNNRIEKFQRYSSNISTEIKQLEAEISNAQKGREQINRYIHSFLGRDEINVDVITDGGNDFFTLKRNSEYAKNLSEGEKTAIAFSFFLTKILEITDFENAIIYIDDPISSLDSNHIFQVNALIKEFFIEKIEGGTNKLKCSQLFLSTHNFEFFNLLRELPLRKRDTEYYFIKRVANNKSSIYRLPSAIRNYKSEYHFLFGELYRFHNSAEKDDYEKLMHIPNSIRRFVELYSYSKIPGNYKSTVDERTDVIFGEEKSKRIMKVLHYFSHSNNINRMFENSDLLCDVENAVTDLMEELEKDTLHYTELFKSLN